MKVSRFAIVAIAAIGFATSAFATALPYGSCTIVGNVDKLQFNTAGGFSYTLKNIVATCNGAVVSNPELPGSSGNVGLGSWNIGYSSSDATLLNRQQSLIQAAAASGMKITVLYSPSSSVPSAADKVWLSLIPTFQYATAP